VLWRDGVSLCSRRQSWDSTLPGMQMADKSQWLMRRKLNVCKLIIYIAKQIN